MEVVFFRTASRHYRSVLRCADVQLEGGSYNRIGGQAGEVPHDIAHLLVEDELGMPRGVWGVLAAGGLFRGASVLAGRQLPHAARRAREVLEGSVEDLNQAEILVRAVCDLGAVGTADAGALRAATGARWWTQAATGGPIARAHRRLWDAGTRWAQLEPGERLRLVSRLAPDR